MIILDILIKKADEFMVQAERWPDATMDYWRKTDSLDAVT